MICGKCGHNNRKGTKFCTSCGSRLPKRQNRDGSATGQSQVKVALVAGSVLLAAIVWGLKPGAADRQSSSPLPAPKKVYASSVIEVASKFLCACGTCDVPELAECTCPTAIDEKDTIERELRAGKSQNQVVALMNDRFGRIKPQFASLTPLPGSDSETGAVKTTDRKPGGSPEEATQDALATNLDQLAIEQHFICACGECGDHVLAECSCDHPRGAKEMKAFITYKISQKRFTIEDIVKAVAYEYGHRRPE